MNDSDTRRLIELEEELQRLKKERGITEKIPLTKDKMDEIRLEIARIKQQQGVKI